MSSCSRLYTRPDTTGPLYRSLNGQFKRCLLPIGYNMILTKARMGRHYGHTILVTDWSDACCPLVTT
jgi:hypothetical protein